MRDFSDRPHPKCSSDGSTKTEPEWAKRVDLKAIAKRFAEAGVQPAPPPPEIFGDQVVAELDAQGLADLVDKRRQFFDTQPIGVRVRCGHSAEVFAEMLETDEGVVELTEAGMVTEESLLASMEPVEPAAQPAPPTEGSPEPPSPPSEPTNSAP